MTVMVATRVPPKPNGLCGGLVDCGPASIPVAMRESMCMKRTHLNRFHLYLHCKGHKLHPTPPQCLVYRGKHRAHLGILKLSSEELRKSTKTRNKIPGNWSQRHKHTHRHTQRPVVSLHYVCKVLNVNFTSNFSK